MSRAAPGALGTLVITPYFPYRDCTPVFRYDTRDVARCLPDTSLRCELAGIPATSQILGKADHLLRMPGGEVVTPRQLIEAIESLPAEPWPARYRAAVRDGRIRLTLPASAIAGYGAAEARRHFAAAGLDIDLDIVGNDSGEPRFAARAATCTKPRSLASAHSSEHDMSSANFPDTHVGSVPHLVLRDHDRRDRDLRGRASLLPTGAAWSGRRWGRSTLATS